MSLLKLDGGLLKEMMANASYNLEQNRENVDALNVFPVPDGDTGTNMSLTMKSATQEALSVDSDSLTRVAEGVSRGALKGARGNSGVILSQLLRGFFRSVQGQETVDAQGFAAAMKNGVDMAYKAVMKPREGTILTVSRGLAEEAMRVAETEPQIDVMLEQAIAAGHETLKRTPELLEVLKQAGVVDSGGMGLMVIYEGFLAAMRGEETAPLTELFAQARVGQPQAQPEREMSAAAALDTNIEFGYCTEFIVGVETGDHTEDVERLKARLSLIGDSMVVVADDDYIKVHVHSNMPGKVLQYALRFGDLHNIKIENMREQHQNLLFQEEAAPAVPARPQVAPITREYAMLTVAAGEGLHSIFTDMAVEGFVEGGQTMNPSTEDIVRAIEGLGARNVFVLPNNGNIIMTAQQADDLVESNVIVIPTKSVPQGVAAVLAFNPEQSVEENTAAMNEAISQVKTGQVTYAVRDSNFDGQDIHEGDIMGLQEGKIVTLGSDVAQTTKDLLTHMVEEDGEEIITLFYGKDTAKAEVDALVAELQDLYPDCDVEAYNGGQPLYYYIISVE